MGTIGGLFDGDPNVTLINTTIADNSGAEGGGVSIVAGQATLSNVTIVDNQASVAGDAFPNRVDRVGCSSGSCGSGAAARRRERSITGRGRDATTPPVQPRPQRARARLRLVKRRSDSPPFTFHFLRTSLLTWSPSVWSRIAITSGAQTFPSHV